MQLIDANSEKISDGDYLEMCNTIKSVHDSMERRHGLGSERYQELSDDLHDQVIMIEKLKDKLKKIKLIKRMTPKTKTQAIRDYADMMGLHSLREYTEDALLTQTTLEPHEVYAWFRGWHNRRQEYRRIFISNVMEECEEERNRIISTLSTYF
jgi:hypothetical protein